MISLKPWWEEHPTVLAEEIQGFKDQRLDFVPDPEEKAAGRIVLRGRAEVAPGEEQNLIIIYPDTFPHTRPAIFVPALDLGRHQNPYGKNLCVLPRASVHWRPSMRAVDLVINNVPELVALVREGGERLTQAEEPQGEPASTFLSFLPTGGVLVAQSMLELDTEAKRGHLTVRFIERDDWIVEAFRGHVDLDTISFGQVVLTHLYEKAHKLLSQADEPITKIAKGPRWNGRWVRLEAHPPSDDPGQLFQAVVEQNNFLKSRDYQNGGVELLGLVFREEVRQGEFEDVWAFLIVKKQPKSAPPKVVIVRGMRYSPLDLGERIPELSPMRDKTVSVVGLGALGGDLVHHLARAQTGTLRLADHDYVEAATGVRWDGGLPNSGVPKPWALKQMVETNYPYVQVAASALYIGATPSDRPQEPERELIGDWLDGADLVIDATAEANVRRVVAHVAHPAGLPQIFLWSVDGYGGVVALLQPKRTGCLLCLERALSPDGGWIPLPNAADPDSLVVQPRGCADRTFTGAYVDLVPLSIQAARLAQAYLCSSESGGYPPFPYNVLVCQVRESDGSVMAPGWLGYKLDPAPDACALCSSAL